MKYAGLLEQNIPRAEVALEQATSYVAELRAEEQQIQELFNETLAIAANPVRAMRVYDDMRDAISEAEQAVDEASLASQVKHVIHVMNCNDPF